MENKKSKIDAVINGIERIEAPLLTENAPYISPAPGQIPIIAESPFTHYKKVFNEGAEDNRPDVTQQDVEDLASCGFNVGMEAVGPWVTAIEAYINLLKGSNVGFMPYSSFLDNPETYKGYVGYFADNKGLVGWDYNDEPLYTELESLQTQYNRLREVDSNRIFFINLVGSPIRKFIGDFEEAKKDEAYVNYVNKFQEMFRPAVWSYDLYPIRVDESGQVVMPENSRSRFYKDFELFSQMAAKTKRPFWAFCQSQAFHTVNSLSGCPAPKEEYLRYEAFSALAYGAQGIVYWTYGQRKNNASEVYTTALVGILEDGSIGRTKYWYYAKKVNEEIKKYTSVFLGCTLVEARHFGFGYGSNTVVDFGPLSEADSKGEGALITHIKNGTQYYIVIVNHSPFVASNITLKFKFNMRITIWGPRTFVNDIIGSTLEVASTDPMNMTLPAGSYMIIPYKKGF